MPSSTIRCMLVDDEPGAIKILREDLLVFPYVEVVGEAQGGWEALRLIAERKPDVVFLDLEMPELGGFDVVKRLEGPDVPLIVVVTAYNDYAIRAFEEGAIDYLLKPVGVERIRKALNRISERIGNRRETLESVASLAFASPGKPRRIVGRQGSDYILLKVDEVLALHAEGELVWIVTAKQRILATQTLRALEERLEGSSFRRVHRNMIINMDYVRKVNSLGNQRFLLTLSNGQEVSVSKRQGFQVRDIIRP